jgi:hypothetical protein
VQVVFALVSLKKTVLILPTAYVRYGYRYRTKAKQMNGREVDAPGLRMDAGMASLGFIFKKNFCPLFFI